MSRPGLPGPRAPAPTCGSAGLAPTLAVPGSPELLLTKLLASLTEVFRADITALARRTGGRLVLMGATGLADDDPAYTDGWLLPGPAVQALHTGQAVNWVSALPEPASAPPPVVGSVAWIPLASEPGVEYLLMLVRRCRTPFTGSELQVLATMAARLPAALTERQHRAGIEQLARYGHLLARHLQPEPLLDEAVALLCRLVGADRSWLVTVHGEQARLRAHRGLSARDLTDWPRPADGFERWRPRPAPPGAPELLRVPIHHDGNLTAMLFAARQRSGAFSEESGELAAIFANHLAVAMVNAELYGTLQRSATRDPLTGLANRTVVNQHIERVLGAHEPGRVGLLFCDLDRFKTVNDLLGHEAGDDLLQQVGERLRGSVRPGDLLARFGGDEFVIVLDAVTSLAEVAEVGKRVCRALDREFMLRSERVRVSASVGGVLGVPGRTTASVMLRNADAALYVAKDRGLGQVEVFDEAASHRALDRLDLRAELRHAIEREQLRLLYQPIVSMTDGQVIAFEVVLRWHHPRHGWVPQEVLVPLAEDTGAMDSIGDWVLGQACRQLVAWQRLPGAERLAVSVNLSADQLRPAGAAARLLSLIRGAGAHPQQVWLQVDQQRLRCEEITAQAQALRAAGLHFVLDGFGTAYSSLRFLHRFPIDILKIDLQVASEVTHWEKDSSLVRAILAIAESLQLTAVGQGVETASQQAALRGLGCRLGQGPLVCQPLPADEASAFLRGSLRSPAATTAGNTGTSFCWP